MKHGIEDWMLEVALLLGYVWPPNQLRWDLWYQLAEELNLRKKQA